MDHFWRRRVVRMGLVLALAMAYGFVFRDRTDYLGHFLAGFGATLAVLSLVLLCRTRFRPALILGATLVAIALGWGTESTIFKLAIFDPVDFFNQSLGAVMAGSVVLGDDGARLSSVWFFAVGVSAVVGGFFFAFA